MHEIKYFFVGFLLFRKYKVHIYLLVFYNFYHLKYSFVSEIGYVMLFMHQEDDEDVHLVVSYFFIVEKFLWVSHDVFNFTPH